MDDNPMLPEKREELLRRRRRLQQRRESDAAEKGLQQFLEPLERAGIVYSVAEDEPLVEWIESRFTIRWNAIDWAAVAERRCAQEDSQNLSVWLSELAAAKSLGDPSIAVVFADSGFPCLQMRYNEFAMHARTVVDFNWQTWLFNPSDDWIIEFHHDGDWCWGRVPASKGSTPRAD